MASNRKLLMGLFWNKFLIKSNNENFQTCQIKIWNHFVGKSLWDEWEVRGKYCEGVRCEDDRFHSEKVSISQHYWSCSSTLKHGRFDKDLSLSFFLEFLLLFQGHLSDHVILKKKNWEFCLKYFLPRRTGLAHLAGVEGDSSSPVQPPSRLGQISVLTDTCYHHGFEYIKTPERCRDHK